MPIWPPSFAIWALPLLSLAVSLTMCTYFLRRIHAAKDFVEQVKRESSKFVKTLRPNLEQFYWQRGYGIFSVSPTHRMAVETYIAKQAEHHRVKSFQIEYREFLDRYAIQYDERYVWE